MRITAWTDSSPLAPALVLFVLVLAASAAGCAGADGSGSAGSQGTSILLGTTTSTQDSGLLDVLLPAFTDQTGIEVRPIAVGSGAALELGRRGEVDVLLVHSPAAEQELVDAGVTGRRLPVMHNDFVIVGPPEDPASVASVRDASRALAQIAEAGATFVSRGDDSGTHARELALWAEAGHTAADRGTYIEAGQGMGATLRLASERGGYTLSDRGTFTATAAGQGNDLVILLEGDAELINSYHVITLSSAAGDRVEVAGAEQFADWMVSNRAQRLIDGYRVDGQRLFTPDAVSADEG